MTAQDKRLPYTGCYEIIVQGQLDALWTDWFADLELTNLPDGRAVLLGPLPDQAALQGVLQTIFNLNLKLISLRKIG